MQKLLMPFIDQSTSFVLGWEAAYIWAKMERGEILPIWKFHKENTEQIKLICNYFHYSYSITPEDDEWSWITALPKFDAKLN